MSEEVPHLAVDFDGCEQLSESQLGGADLFSSLLVGLMPEGRYGLPLSDSLEMVGLRIDLLHLLRLELLLGGKSLLQLLDLLELLVDVSDLLLEEEEEEILILVEDLLPNSLGLLLLRFVGGH